MIKPNHSYAMRYFRGGPRDGCRAYVALAEYEIPLPRRDGYVTLPPQEWARYEGREDGALHFLGIVTNPNQPSAQAGRE